MLKVIIHDENLMPINIYGQNYAEFISEGRATKDAL